AQVGGDRALCLRVGGGQGERQGLGVRARAQRVVLADRLLEADRQRVVADRDVVGQQRQRRGPQRLVGREAAGTGRVGLQRRGQRERAVDQVTRRLGARVGDRQRRVARRGGHGRRRGRRVVTRH